MTKFLEQRISIVTTWANNTLTCVSSAAHLLNTGDTPIISLENYGNFQNSVTVVNPTSFTIANFPRIISPTPGTLILDFFSAGQTGRIAYKVDRKNPGVSNVLHTLVVGAGGARYTAEVSMNGEHWVAISDVTHATTTGDSEFTPFEPSWAFAAINITSIGVDTRLKVILDT